MTHLVHGTRDTWQLSLSLAVVVMCAALVYGRGWLSLRSGPFDAVPGWRAATSFLLGLFLIWVAAGSPIASWDMELLTVHMVQHLLLMTVAAPLILLGAPVRPFLLGLPRFVLHAFARPAFCRPLQRVGRTLRRPVVCWLSGAATLVGWHIPAALTLAMHSEMWHAIELASFLGAGSLFWWPVVESWRNASSPAGWSIVVYLFLATIPCDILSAFLVFSERVAYPVYLSMPRQSAFSVLEDQQVAGALMWTVVTIVYLIAGGILTARLLSPQHEAGGAFVRLQFGSTVSFDDDADSTRVV
jgi:cytochrome c oxidase assembly factor CtaG